MAGPLSSYALPCPECREQGHTGRARIGNRRKFCNTCNAFAQAVMRSAKKRLAEEHAEEYERLKLRAEYDLYPGVIESWSLKHGIIPGLEGQQ